MEVKKVVEIGCDRLRNLKILQEFFTEITLVDTKLQCERINDLVPKGNNIQLLNTEEFNKDNQEFEAAFIISVLHIIPETKKRAISSP